MATEAELIARRNSLSAAIASGVLSVRHGDVQTQYRSMAEMEKALRHIDADLAQVRAPAAKRFRVTRFTADKGFR